MLMRRWGACPGKVSSEAHGAARVILPASASSRHPWHRVVPAPVDQNALCSPGVNSSGHQDTTDTRTDRVTTRTTACQSGEIGPSAAECCCVRANMAVYGPIWR